MADDKESPDNPSRRRFLKYGAALGIAATIGAAGISLHNKQAYGLEARDTATNATTSAATQLSFVDAHDHLVKNLTLDDLISRMDSAGVDKTVLFPVFVDPSREGITDVDLVIKWHNQQPDRIIPFFGMQRSELVNRKRWENPDSVAENLLKLMDSELQSKPYKGIGEFLIRHYAYQLPLGQYAGDVNVPVDSTLMRRFLDLAAEYNLPINIHCEAEDETIPPLKKMLEYKPEVNWIWAHCTGRPTPDTSRSMLKQYPNLYSDLGAMNSEAMYGHVNGNVGGQPPKNPIEDGKGHLRQDWKGLFEEFPDRFMVGLDIAHPEPWFKTPEYHGKAVNKFRSLMSDLSASTAKKLLYENAMRILNLS